MSRHRAEPSVDRVIATHTADDPLYRVAGVEPHGWSTVLIEDKAGRFYVAATATGRLSEVRPDDARRLFRDRTFRRWHGDRTWSSFDRLPLMATMGGRPVPPDAAQGDSPL